MIFASLCVLGGLACIVAIWAVCFAVDDPNDSERTDALEDAAGGGSAGTPEIDPAVSRLL